MSKTIKKDDKNSQEPLKLVCNYEKNSYYYCFAFHKNLESTTESIDIPKVTSDIRPISVTIEGFRHIVRIQNLRKIHCLYVNILFEESFFSNFRYIRNSKISQSKSWTNNKIPCNR